MAFYKFPSIEKPKDIVPRIMDELMTEVKTITLKGTTKLHGTNAALVFNPDETIGIQSRSRLLDVENDNADFFASMTSIAGVEATDKLKKQLAPLCDKEDTIIVYGEWCGKGIQKSVAVNEVEKMFVIFKIKTLAQGWLNTSTWSSIKVEPLIRNIAEIPIFKFTFNREDPNSSIRLIQNSIDSINDQCPFMYGLFGIKGVGEGLVLQPSCSESSRYWFKMKGERHQAKVPKMKVKTPINDLDSTSINEFVYKQVTMERLASARETLTKPTRSYKPIIDWVVADIFREEETDEIDEIKLRKAISRRVVEIIEADRI